jgi:transcription antitermination protein NusB
VASNRHLGRIVALQTLYELDFRIEVQEKNLDVEAIIARNIDRYSEIMNDKKFVVDMVQGVLADNASLDGYLQPLAPDWPLNQIARIDRTILRMGLWEMKSDVATPVKVIINEAVELAKGFGAENASKFVNGVLGSAAKQLGKVTETKTKGAKKKLTHIEKKTSHEQKITKHGI